MRDVGFCARIFAVWNGAEESKWRASDVGASLLTALVKQQKPLSIHCQIVAAVAFIAVLLVSSLNNEPQSTSKNDR